MGLATEQFERNISKVIESPHVQVDLNSAIFTNSSNWDISHKQTFANYWASVNFKGKGWLQNFLYKRKLNFFGHMKRHDSLEKAWLEGQVPGKRSRGRQRRRWEDCNFLLGV